MGAFTYIDPTTIRCMPGKILVEIIEILGGTTKSGIWLPPQDHMGKDTFYGKVLQVGPPPALEHYKSGPGPGLDVRDNRTGATWPDKVMQQFNLGDIVLFPRDVPMVFVWEERRFGICLIHEAIVAFDGAEFNAEGFEVRPWTPQSLEGAQMLPIAKE